MYYTYEYIYEPENLITKSIFLNLSTYIKYLSSNRIPNLDNLYLYEFVHIPT